jgi:ribonuclease HI
MKVYFDGGLRKNLIAIVNGDNYVEIKKRLYDNEDYEWDALELALDHIKQLDPDHKNIELIGDNNQVIRWIQSTIPEDDSIVKQKCLHKLTNLRESGHRIIGIWVKRNENLAGRALEYHTSHSSKPTEFMAKWYACSRCVYKSLSDKEKEEHFYNEHITNG